MRRLPSLIAVSLLGVLMGACTSAYHLDELAERSERSIRLRDGLVESDERRRA